MRPGHGQSVFCCAAARTAVPAVKCACVAGTGCCACRSGRIADPPPRRGCPCVFSAWSDESDVVLSCGLHGAGHVQCGHGRACSRVCVCRVAQKRAFHASAARQFDFSKFSDAVTSNEARLEVDSLRSMYFDMKTKQAAESKKSASVLSLFCLSCQNHRLCQSSPSKGGAVRCGGGSMCAQAAFVSACHARAEDDLQYPANTLHARKDALFQGGACLFPVARCIKCGMSQTRESGVCGSREGAYC